MNFELSDEQKLIRHTAREFVRSEILPVATACDREARFPMEVYRKARELGLVNMTVPTEFGGSGWGALDQAVDKLPQSLKLVFLLRDISGLTTLETAEALGLSETAVKTRLSRARLRLRDALSEYFTEHLGEQANDQK